MTEVWGKIPDTDDEYFVSNRGRVRRGDKLLTPSPATGGYMQVTIKMNDRFVTKKVHKLVGQIFLEHKPSGHSEVVHHRDGDKSNNHLSNLNLVSNRENVQEHFLNTDTSSRFVGVTWCDQIKKWKSRIRIGKETIFIVSSDNEFYCHAAYNTALKHTHIYLSNNDKDCFRKIILELLT